MVSLLLPYPDCGEGEVIGVDDASSVGTVDGLDSIMMVRVLVEVRPDWSVST